MTHQKQGQCSPSTNLDPLSILDWGRMRIDRAREKGSIPSPGSAEWRALPDTDPRKVAAVIEAAWAWADNAIRADPATEMNAFLDALARFDDELDRLIEKRTALAVARSQDWSRIGPAWEELQRRRAIYVDRPPLDREALRRWVETGHSAEQDPNAA